VSLAEPAVFPPSDVVYCTLVACAQIRTRTGSFLRQRQLDRKELPGIAQ
jgi:hypothetical protein